MHYLFISYSFPGVLGPMAAWLALNPKNRVIVASSRSQHDRIMGNARRVVLKTWQYRNLPENPGYFDLWAQAGAAGKSARASLMAVRDSGFEPDMIFISSTNGAALDLEEIFPGAFRVNFLEEEYFWSCGQTAMRRDVQRLQILHAQMSFAFSRQCRDAYAKMPCGTIEIAPLMVDAGFFVPANARSLCPGKEIVSVFCHSHLPEEQDSVWRMCMELLNQRPQCRIMLFPGNAVILRKMAEMRMPKNLAARLRVELAPRQELLRDALSSSRIAFFPEFHMEPDILKAMACATPPVVTHEMEGLEDGVNMCMISAKSAEARASELASLLDQPEKLGAIGLAARENILKHHDSAVLMPEFYPLIEAGMKQWQDSGKVRGSGQ